MKRFFLLVAVLLLVACATSPTGRSQLMMVSDSQMAAAGQQMFAQLKDQQPVVHDAMVSGEVQCVVNALLRELPVDQRNGWEVQVFDDKTPNAFALPGRKIGVHSGMLRLVENEAQLAAVIGHEVAHVLARHANERASMAIMSQLGAGMADIVAPGTGDVVNIGSQIGVLLPYSRAHESEADVMGQALMARAGFDPMQSIVLWQLMQRQNGGGGSQFLSTHPSSGNRIQLLQRQLKTTVPLYEQARAAGRQPHCRG